MQKAVALLRGSDNSGDITGNGRFFGDDGDSVH
jgi:hypothetical protein